MTHVRQCSTDKDETILRLVSLSVMSKLGVHASAIVQSPFICRHEESCFRYFTTQSCINLLTQTAEGFTKQNPTSPPHLVTRLHLPVWCVWRLHDTTWNGPSAISWYSIAALAHRKSRTCCRVLFYSRSTHQQQSNALAISVTGSRPGACELHQRVCSHPTKYTSLFRALTTTPQLSMTIDAS